MISRELVGDVAAETEVELRLPLGTGMILKLGHDRFMSKRLSVTAAQLVINRSGTTRFIPAQKPGNLPPWAGEVSVFDQLGETRLVPTPGRGSPPLQAGKQFVTSRTTRIPTLPYRGPVQLGQRLVSWRVSNWYSCSRD